MITEATYVIAVPDLARSLAFYRDVLELEIRELGDPGWRLYVAGACRIMAGECRDALPPRELGDHSYFTHASPTAPRPASHRATSHGTCANSACARSTATGSCSRDAGSPVGRSSPQAASARQLGPRETSPRANATSSA
ncbi:MAG TPA: VOC family protein [Kofleriaceae bacterium]